MSFKLIGIRPLPNCNTKFLKNLEPNYIYQFFQNYNFYTDNDLLLNNKKLEAQIIKVVKTKESVEGLYNLRINNPLTGTHRFLDINISAVVGKNGSGKSTLLELLYVAFYKISRIANVISFKDKDFQKVKQTIDSISTFAEKENIDDEDIKIFESNAAYVKNKVDHLLQLAKDKKKYDKNTEKINVEFIYAIDDIVYILRLNNETLSLKSFKDHRSTDINNYEYFKTNINQLFYNLVINYSLYGLNSAESGKWIEKIFHKNDSYQTPIVLNPFRHEGNIDINSENYLVRSRLLSILFDQNIADKELAKNKTVSRIKLTFDEKPDSQNSIYQAEFEKKVFPELYKKFFNKNDSFVFELKDGLLNKKILEYILRKISLIPERYPTFKEYYDENSLIKISQIKKFVDQLYTDRSHITLKLRQALNFYEFQDYLTDDILNEECTFQIQELAVKIDSYDKPFSDAIDYVPPSFFKIELYFDNSEENNFSNLSSGEKQKIFSLNSIIYHLRNLLSVNFNSKKTDLLVYNNFNIVLDEIELYYHPELQRTFIFDLLKYLEKINYSALEILPNLNIIFITHSPFILSDLPSTNILYMKNVGKKSIDDIDLKKSFGANIHELLGDNFFLGEDDVFMGEFAKNKITDTITWLNEIKDEQLKDENSVVFEKLKKEKNSRINIITTIDEPILKQKLLEMYSEVFGNGERLEFLKSEKIRIDSEIKNLENTVI